jgi:hypothetical protein
VRFVAENYPNVARGLGRDVRAEFSLVGLDGHTVRPSIRVKPISAAVLGMTTDGEPVLFGHGVGRGVVYFFSDAIELGDGEAAEKLRRQFYGAVLRAAGIEPLRVAPNEPWLHVMAQPTASGTVHVVYNTKLEEGQEPVELPTAAGRVRLLTRNRWPALAAVTREGKVVATVAYGEASAGVEPLVRGEGLKALLSLDGEDLRESRAILVAPFEPGRVELPSPPGDVLAVVGEFRSGKWTPFERIDFDEAAGAVEIDADRTTCLILVCSKGTETRWAERLGQALVRPQEIGVY